MIKRDVVLAGDLRGYSWESIMHTQHYLSQQGIEARVVNLGCSTFADKESKPILEGEIKGAKVFYWNDPMLHPDSWRVRSQDAFATLRDYGAKTIDYVAPYLHLSRQDKKRYKAEKGKKVPKTISTAKNYAKQIRDLIDGVITLDLHSPRIKTYYPGKYFLDLQSSYLFADYLLKTEKHLDNHLAASTDEGRVGAARLLSELTGIGCVFGIKVRDEYGKLKECCVIGDVLDKIIDIGEDIIDTGGTVEKFTEDVLNKGAKAVNVFAGHGLFNNDAIMKRLYRVKKIVVTNSLKQNDPKVIVVPCNDLIAGAIKFRLDERDPKDVKEVYSHLIRTNGKAH
jgi:ribose-phosphate pyrophosphokinase